jgi:hypothetical protein
MTRPYTLPELRAMNLRTFRLSPLPEVSREFGHSPAILDRVAAEHSAEMVRVERGEREAKRDG